MEQGVLLGLATTTSRINAEALLSARLGPQWRELFAAVICGEDAPRRKPDPQSYLRCLEALRLDPEDAIAVEDSANGLAAASAAGIPTLVTRSVFFARSAYPGALAVCERPRAPGRALAAPARRAPGARRSGAGCASGTTSGGRSRWSPEPAPTRPAPARRPALAATGLRDGPL
jgi:hypothetical protein